MVSYQQRINEVLNAVEVPRLILVAVTKKSDYKKPHTAMWQLMVEHFNGGLTPDLKYTVLLLLW